MFNLQGYQSIEMIYEGPNSIVYRAKREIDQKVVILKALTEQYPAPTTIARFKQEYELTRYLAFPGVVKAYELLHVERWLIILEDFGGESLARLRLAGKFQLIGNGLTRFLSLGIKISTILGQIHQQQVIHKDINPSNIVLNPTTDEVKLIDFGISTILEREMPAFKNLNAQNKSPAQGTLAYMSPEQTGRMNRPLDYRTDFYSLGVTFYELLTGQLPFVSDQPLALVHSHIAKEPLSPTQLNPDIPAALSQIILKLMAKNAEERYQAAYGLRADLEECLRQVQETGQVSFFTLGKQDRSEHLLIPAKLYGREQEIKLLLKAFERVSQGSIELILVAGYSGIGKSALVKEIYKPITASSGYFISGKFDQLQKKPYLAFIQAFQSLIHQLLTEDDAQIKTWTQKLLGALGPNAQVMIDVIPELELIIGAQSDVPVLGPMENRNRFNHLFESLIQVFAQPEHPLTIFLDDLQWADHASLKLLELLMKELERRSSKRNALFVIGAYRDNEVSPAHPLMQRLEKIRQADTMVNEIFLSPLDDAQVLSLVSETFLRSDAQSLAKFVLDKTGGNPFFVTEFLKSLHSEGFITFDHEAGGWQWDLDELYTQEDVVLSLTDDLVDLMASKVQKLPQQAQAVLKLAACIGNRFDLETLAIVCQKEAEETARVLSPALKDGLLLPLSHAYITSLEAEGKPSAASLTLIPKGYKFAHDRIQQAVYSLISDTLGDKQATHLLIGRLLLQKTSQAQLSEHVFDIVNQLNQATSLISDQALKIQLAHLNLMAGQKAKKATAYEPAFNYLTIGHELLPEDSWQGHYDLTLKLHIEAAEAAYLSGDFEKMEQLVAIVVQKSRSVLDKVNATMIQIRAYIAGQNSLKAVQTGLSILEALGIKFPKKISKLHLGLALGKVKFALLRKSPMSLIELEVMSDEHKIAAMRIMSLLAPASYQSHRELFPLLVLQQVRLSIRYGHIPDSAFAYTTYGLILCGIIGDIEQGYEFGRLALSLQETLDGSQFKSQVLFSLSAFINHWKVHLRDTFTLLLSSYRSGYETGDLLYAALAAYLYCTHSYFSGQELPTLEREIASYSEAVRLLNHRNTLYRMLSCHHATLSLLAHSSISPLGVNEGAEIGNVEEIIPILLSVDDGIGVFNAYLHKLILAYLFGQYAEASEQASHAESHLDRVRSTVLVPLFYFYDALIHLAIIPSVDKAKQKKMQKKVAASQKKMAKWGRSAPMNYKHKYYLVEAERANVLGQDKDAREYYDQAISLAQEHQYVNEEALANELAAGFYFLRGQSQLGQFYLQRAHYAYQRWGAYAKVEHLGMRIK